MKNDVGVCFVRKIRGLQHRTRWHRSNGIIALVQFFGPLKEFGSFSRTADVCKVSGNYFLIKIYLTFSSSLMQHPNTIHRRHKWHREQNPFRLSSNKLNWTFQLKTNNKINNCCWYCCWNYSAPTIDNGIFLWRIVSFGFIPNEIICWQNGFYWLALLVASCYYWIHRTDLFHCYISPCHRHRAELDTLTITITFSNRCAINSTDIFIAYFTDC